MEIRNIPESQRRELAAWTARRTYQLMQDPLIREEFEIWKAERTKKKVALETRPTKGGQ